MTDDQIKHMIDRFLSWRLPDDFRPDGGVQFDPDGATKLDPRNRRYEPSGTNLLNYAQAKAMVLHMLDGLPGEPDPDAVGCAEREVGRYVYTRIDALADAAPGSPEDAEFDYLTDIAAHVEEYGVEACAGTSLSNAFARLGEQEGAK